MKAVWKYELAVNDYPQCVEIPAFGKIVECEIQGDMIAMWAVVDTEGTLFRRMFCVHGSGHEVKIEEKYIGTVHAPTFVWHVFELI